MKPLTGPFVTDADTAALVDGPIRRIAVLTLVVAAVIVAGECILLFFWINR